LVPKQPNEPSVSVSGYDAVSISNTVYEKSNSVLVCDIGEVRENAHSPSTLKTKKNRLNKKSKIPKTSFPDVFEISQDMQEWALINTPGVDIETETEKFRDYYVGNGKTMIDWTATWRNWMRNAVNFNTFRPANKRESAHEANMRVSRELEMEGWFNAS
jgi:hypothetical protein